jgi:acyl carrier protein
VLTRASSPGKAHSRTSKADSLDVVQALVAVEELFEIEIPDEEAQKFQNFGDFVAYVEGRVSKKEKV